MGRGRCRLLAVVLTVGLLALPGVAGGPAAADEAPTFADVPPTHPFADEIGWLAGGGYAEGWPDGTYRPSRTVTRQALVAVLWRMSGSPTPSTPPPFVDVAPDHPFADAIAWAAADGVTTGWPDGTFRPTEAVTRQALAALLHRLSGIHWESTPLGGFSDVPAGHPFAMAIGWWWATGQARGYSDGTFRGDDAVTRQAWAAFAHRFHASMGGAWPVIDHHAHHCRDPVTPEHEEAADAMVAAVEASLARWPTVADAEAAGYRWVAPPFGGAGAHYVHDGFMRDGVVLDPERPESLMYDGDTLQGAMFVMEQVGEPGPRFAGCLALWHGHDNLCYSAPPTEGGTIVWLADLGGCPAGSMVYVTPQMLHVWIIPRPGGPFEGLET